MSKTVNVADVEAIYQEVGIFERIIRYLRRSDEFVR
jgi:hypothetical protein